MTAIGYPTLSNRVISQEQILKYRTICDEHKLAYSTFCSIIVNDVLDDQELINRYVARARQFDEDQSPATIAELKALRQQVRQQEEELQALREFKELAQNSLNNTKAAYR